MATDQTILYKKEVEGRTLYLLSYPENSHTIFETLIVGKSGNKTVLDRISTNNPLFEDKQKLGFYNIIDFTFHHNLMYIFYNDFGRIFMDEYTVDTDNQIDRKRFVIGAFQPLSFENFGPMHSLCEIKWIENTMYFHIQAWQQLGEKNVTGLYVYNGNKLQRIHFLEEHNKVIKTLCIDRWGIGWYDRNKDNYQALSTKSGVQDPNLERFQLLSQYYGKSYDYHLMGKTGKKDRDENSDLQNDGLTSYPLLSLNAEDKLDTAMFIEAERSLKEILNTFEKKDSAQIKLIDYIYSQNGNISLLSQNSHFLSNQKRYNYLYFFYKEQHVLKIALYTLSQNEWILTDYKIEDIQISN